MAESSMKFAEIYAAGRFGLSFELFPPKTPAGEAALYRHVAQLVRFKPQIITCTYGAGGSTREKTLDVVAEVRRRFGVSVATHLTCVGSTSDQLRDYLHQAADRGVENVVALRGDPPHGQQSFEPAAGGLAHANELVELVRRELPELGVAVGGYPETHQEAASAEVDLENLQRKVAAGADVVITQLFYDNDAFFRFRDRYGRLKIPAPLVPGLLPVTNLRQIRRITELCGARLPADFMAALDRCAADDACQFQVGVDFAIRQTEQLVEQGVPGLHYYVLNKSEATSRVLQAVTLPDSK